MELPEDRYVRDSTTMLQILEPDVNQLVIAYEVFGLPIYGLHWLKLIIIEFYPRGKSIKFSLYKIFFLIRNLLRTFIFFILASKVKCPLS